MKRIVAFFLAAIIALSLCACGGNETLSSSQVKPETITVHAQVPTNWTDPGCWAWSASDEKDAFAQWPGKAMTQINGWYVIDVPSWIDSVIINGNGGSVQTADLSVEMGKDLWVVVSDAENATVFYKEPTVSPEEQFRAVGTLSAEQITANKALVYVYQWEDDEELSKKIDLSLLPADLTASTPEEVRYTVHISYIARRASFYVGSLLVYNTYVNVEICDVLSGERHAFESFPGAKLPETITSDSGKYYADYPDEAEIVKWICQQLQIADEVEAVEQEARLEEALALAQSIIGPGCFSYDGLIAALMDPEASGFTYEEAAYAADNCGADWFEEAAESAVRYVGWGIDDKELLVQMLEEDGYTQEQAVYGAENSGL